MGPVDFNLKMLSVGFMRIFFLKCIFFTVANGH